MVKRLIDDGQRARLGLEALIKKETERIAVERLEARGAVQRTPDGKITIKEAHNGGRGL
jgi:hypothetical protein